MDDQSDARDAALRRLKAKSAFKRSLAVYVIVNAFLVVVWAMGDRGSFWPIWPIAGWGLAIGFQAWNVYGAQPPSETAIRREMERGS